MNRLLLALLVIGSAVLSYGQSGSGTIRGTVLDPSGAAVRGATVTISNPVSHYQQSANADAQGVFEFNNIPFNNYHLTARAMGFSNSEQDVDVRSGVPLEA